MPTHRPVNVAGHANVDSRSAVGPDCELCKSIAVGYAVGRHLSALLARLCNDTRCVVDKILNVEADGMRRHNREGVRAVANRLRRVISSQGVDAKASSNVDQVGRDHGAAV